MYYVIESESDGETFALSADQDPSKNDLLVYAKNAADDRQQWQPVAWFGGATTPVGVLLLNNHSGMAAFSPAAAGSNAYVTQIALSDITPDNVGQATWAFAGHGTATVIRTTGDSHRNLNVQGGGTVTSGTPVIVFEWGGGKDNEVWIMSQVD